MKCFNKKLKEIESTNDWINREHSLDKNIEARFVKEFVDNYNNKFLNTFSIKT